MDSQEKNSRVSTFLHQSELNDNSVVLKICEDSVDSQHFLAPSANSNNLADVVTYRLIDKAKQEPDDSQNNSNFLHKSPGTEQFKSNCGVFLIKEFQNDNQIASVNPRAIRNNPRPIAPKFSSSNCISSVKRNFVIEPYKKRDEKKRATHNEVERRRRDKINSWIFKLKELIPETETANSPTDSKQKTNGADSKSQILIRACEYIKEMQIELKSLRECLMKNDNLRLSNQQMQLERDVLKSSNTHSTDNVEENCEGTLIKNDNRQKEL